MNVKKIIQRSVTGLVVSFVAVGAVVAGPVTAASAGEPETISSLVNNERAAVGLPGLARNASLDAVATNWANQMGAEQRMYHNPNYSKQIPAGWTRAGENVAYGYPTGAATMTAWMNSPGHKANILGDFNSIGIGWTVVNGKTWSVQVFAKYSNVVTPPATPNGPVSSAVNPTGNFDSIKALPNEEIQVTGWAVDRNTDSPISVHIYVGSAGKAFTADASRPDVDRVYPGYGANHGFVSIVKGVPGVNNVCAYAINVGGGSNVLLGCKTVVVTSGSPTGSFDQAIGNKGSVTVRGWAIDRDVPSQSLAVHIYVDAAGLAISANTSRPDVQRVYPTYSATAGFDATISASPGNHNVCAYGINAAGTAGSNNLLGCKTVTVK